MLLPGKYAHFRSNHWSIEVTRELRIEGDAHSARCSRVPLPITMSLVNIANINVLNNPAPFNSPLEFEITFECNAELKDGKGIELE